jgi:hypothetical protein
VVFEVMVQFVVAPLLVAAATVAARAWGHGIGGLVSAFPAIVGPVLLIGAHRHGAGFAGQAATGTLLGLAGLSGFALAYGRAARTASWPVSLAAGWFAAAVAAALAGATGAGLPGALAVAVASLALARRGLPSAALPPAWPDPPRGDLPLRMALTALLVVSLAAAGGRLGPAAGGLLAALPVLACILAVFTHGRCGGAAAAELLRGMLGGMAGFVVFCALVAAFVGRAGVATTFTAATLAAVAVQGGAAWGSLRRPTRPRLRPARIA